MAEFKAAGRNQWEKLAAQLYVRGRKLSLDESGGMVTLVQVGSTSSSQSWKQLGPEKFLISYFRLLKSTFLWRPWRSLYKIGSTGMLKRSLYLTLKRRHNSMSHVLFPDLTVTGSWSLIEFRVPFLHFTACLRLQILAFKNLSTFSSVPLPGILLQKAPAKHLLLQELVTVEMPVSNHW